MRGLLLVTVVLTMIAAPARALGEDIHVLFTFTNVDTKPDLQRKAAISLGSLVENLKLSKGERLVVHLVADPGSQSWGARVLAHEQARAPRVRFVFHDADTLVQPIAPLIEVLRRHFGSQTFDAPIFFLSTALHRVLPAEIHRIIKLDLDILVRVNIADLYRQFRRFRAGEVIGLAPDLQPVYFHLLEPYRKSHPGATAGEKGQQGFNAGVALYDLDAMRRSATYQAALGPAAIDALAAKYGFRGHLGDQDFYTLVGFEHPELFHALDCTWNRQLCTWWQTVRPEVFDEFHACAGEARILHGNCGTPISGSERFPPLDQGLPSTPRTGLDPTTHEAPDRAAGSLRPMP